MPTWWGYVAFYFPLGAIGIWRWSVWLVKKWYAAQYRPQAGRFEASVGVVTPVYNEDPVVFQRALTSWKDNGVVEIVAVIDYTDETCIAVFKKFSETFSGARLVVTKTPGKRPALADGVRVASKPFVALVDSDTIWGRGVRAAALVPFADPQVGGVATRQSVLEVCTLPQRVFNSQLTLRCLEELPFMVARGGTVITCISGRTAFYRRAAVVPLLHDLEHETFGGHPVISGDDKCLTYLVERAGWKVAFQQLAHVYTPGMRTWRMFLKQRLRWTRNSWRADLRTLTQVWVWHHPRFALYLLDRAVQPFAQTLAPLFLVVGIVLQQWLPIVIIVTWWHVGRAIRMWPVIKQRPYELFWIPLYMLVNFFIGVMKIYALVTMNRQGWMTRWHKSRLPQLRWLGLVPGYVATVVIVGLLGGLVWIPTRGAARSLEPMLLPSGVATALAANLPAVGEAVLDRYQITLGDSLTRIAQNERLDVERLVAFNGPWLPSRKQLTPGLWLTIPRGTTVVPQSDHATRFDRVGSLHIAYEPSNNTIIVRGRGQRVTLRTLAQAAPQLVREVAPGEWYLTANVHVRLGVQLAIAAPEARWLKLKSTPEQFVSIRATDGQLFFKGVKVTSWNEAAQAVDENWRDGRSFVAASGLARLDATEAEFAYLGYAPLPKTNGVPSGVAWKLPDETHERYLVTGYVLQSFFHHNYHGGYVFGGQGMVWEDNRLVDNIANGLELTGRAEVSRIDHNELAGNGRHGIQLGGRSERIVVRGNRITGQQRHGISITDGTVRTVVIDNEILKNEIGVDLADAGRVLLLANRLHNNRRGVRLSVTGDTYMFGNQFVNNWRTGLHDWLPTTLPNYSGNNIVQ